MSEPQTDPRHAEAAAAADAGEFSKADYEALARFRYGLRLYFRFSERAVRLVGLTPQQYQLMLAIKGFPGREWGTVTELAERLQSSHNSVVGLIDRTEANGMVERRPHATDRRAVAVYLTAKGDETLAKLVGTHREELERLASMISLPPLHQRGH
ncbi:MAG TPA: MarR family transcriptional regulator [Dehalococcoidia bacterium]|nr:MarR family transcriptional regulator [Dehalococcoidia bacterium]